MPSSGTNVCFDLYTAYPVRDYLVGIQGGVGIGGVILGMIYFLSAAVTIVWIKQQQQNARQGMEGAAMHVIFPIYLPFLWCSSLSDALVGLVILFCNINFRKANPWDNAVTVAVAFALQHFVIEGTAFVLMQYGCGWRAVKNAAWWASGWAVASFLVQFMLYYDGDTEISFLANLLWNTMQLVFYGTLWFAPETRLFRRGAVIYYSRFWTILRLCVIIQDVLFRYGTTNTQITASNCIYAVMVLPVFIIFKPIVVYKSLLFDSVWWQGLNQRSVLGSIAVSITPSSSNRSLATTNNRGRNGGNNGSGNGSKMDSWFSKMYISLFGETTMPLTEQSLSRSQSLASSKHSQRGLPTGRDSSRNSLASDHFPYHIVSTNHDDEESAERDSNSLAQDDSLQNAALLIEQQQLRSPLVGFEVGFSEAQALAKEVDHIRKEGTVRLLNFAYLTIDRQNAPATTGTTIASNIPITNSGAGGNNKNSNNNPNMPSIGSVSGLLGTGSFSRVYAGWYKHNRVAIKMLFTQDLNPDVIRRYSNEARILSELSASPNVVKIYGVAVLPPSICIVLEICEFGSLSDVLRGCQQTNSQRAPLLLTMADRMYLALGCARGLAALHAYAPDLCHRDIKSMNFLIDRHLNAKIADLDLGVEYARKYAEKKRHYGILGSSSNQNNDTDSDNSFGQRMSSTDSFSGHHTNALGAAMGQRNHHRSLTSFLLGGFQSNKSSAQQRHHPLYPQKGQPGYNNSKSNGKNGNHGGFQYSKKFGRSHGMNITWQAPEVLLGISYSQKSDVYSLGLVMWEIIAAGRTVKKYSMTTGGSGNNSNSSSSGNGNSNITATSVSYASVPFSECKSQNEICERVVQGFRPSITPFLPAQSSDPNQPNHNHNHNHNHHHHAAKNGSMLVDPQYLDILQRCWDMDPHHRPLAKDVEAAIQATWLHCVHRIMRTTSHTVDSSILAQEHAKVARELTEHQQKLIQHTTPHKRVKIQRTRLSPPSPALMTTLDALRHDLRWHDLDTDADSPSQLWNHSEGCYLVVAPTHVPATTAPASYFTQSLTNGLQEFRRMFQTTHTASSSFSNPSSSAGAGANGTVSDQLPYFPSSSTASAAAYPAAPATTLTSYPSNPSFSASASQAQPYVVAPYHCIVWATRKWLHRMGFLMHDILAMDVIQGLKSHHTDELALRTMLQQASDPATACSQTHHVVTRLCRRDGREVTLSIHAFPVFHRQPQQTSVHSNSNNNAQNKANTSASNQQSSSTTAGGGNSTTKNTQNHAPQHDQERNHSTASNMMRLDMSLNSIEDDDLLFQDESNSFSNSSSHGFSSNRSSLSSSNANVLLSATPTLLQMMMPTNRSSAASSKHGSLSETLPPVAPTTAATAVTTAGYTPMLMSPPTVTPMASSSFSQTMKFNHNNNNNSSSAEDISASADYHNNNNNSNAGFRRTRVPSSAMKVPAEAFAFVTDPPASQNLLTKNIHNEDLSDDDGGGNDDSGDDDDDDDAYDDEDDEANEHEEDAAQGGLEHTDRQRLLTQEALLVSQTTVKRRKYRQHRRDRRQQRQERRAAAAVVNNNTHANSNTTTTTNTTNTTTTMNTTSSMVKKTPGTAYKSNVSSAPNSIWRDVPSVPATPALYHRPEINSNSSSNNNNNHINTTATVTMDGNVDADDVQSPLLLLSETEPLISISPDADTTTSNNNGRAEMSPVGGAQTKNPLFTSPAVVTHKNSSGNPSNINNANNSNNTNSNNANSSNSTNVGPQVAFIVLQFSFILGDPNKQMQHSS